MYIYNIIDSNVNYSDHLAVKCCFKLNTSISGHVAANSRVNDMYSVSKYVWSNAAKRSYYQSTGYAIQMLLYDYIAFFTCTGCHDSIHKSVINKFYCALIAILRDCNTPFYKTFHKCSSSVVWNKNLSMLKNASKVTYNMWNLSGRPENGPVWEQMVATRKNYRKAVKLNKKQCMTKKLNVIDVALVEGNNVKFWKKWNECTSNNCSISHSSLNADELATNFSHNFINSMDNAEVVNEFVSLFENHCKTDESISFTVESIESALSQLKQSNALDVDRLGKKHIVEAHPSLLLALKYLFNACLSHGCIPDGLSKGLVIPLLKKHNLDINVAESYRPITIAPIVGKLFESCLCSILEPFCDSQPYQLGFVNEGGTNKAIFAVESTVKYFNEKESDVFVCSLDAEKAFDRVNHYFLFCCLLLRGMPINVINVFISWYSKTKLVVNWQGNFSKSFEIKSGVLQGSLISPKFFNIVMDSLLAKLESSNLGCRVGDCYAGAIAYADDLILISPSRSALQKMLNLCATHIVRCGFNSMSTNLYAVLLVLLLMCVRI